MVSHRYAAGVLPVALVAVGVLAPVQSVQAQAPTKQAMQAIYNKQSAALMKRDLDGMLAFSSPDFVAITATGQKVGLAQQKQQLQMLLPVAKEISAKSVVQSVKPAGSGVVVRQKAHFSLSMVNPQTKKLTTMVVDGVADDSWAKTGGKWLRTSSKEVSQSMTVDGKPFVMPGGQR
jgi:hypothetical protein